MHTTHVMHIPWLRLSEGWFLVFLLISPLLKGGKSLAMTWILVSVAWLCTIGFYNHRESATGAALPQGEVPRRIWWVCMGFFLWTALSFLFSRTRNYGMDELLREGSLLLLFLWLMRNGMQSSRMLRAVRASVVLSLCIGLPVYLLQPVNRFVGAFFDPRFHTDYWPNAWAEFLLLAWPLFLLDGAGVLARFQEPYKSFSSFRRALMLGVLLAALLLSYSRGAVLVFGMQIFLLFLVYWRVCGSASFRLYIRRLVPLAMTVGTLAWVLFVSVNALRAESYPVQSVAEKVTFTASEGASSIDERMQFWSQALVLSFHHPMLGFGPYSFRFVQPSLEQGVLATSDHPHNVILKFSMERGLVAAGLFLLLLFLVLVPFLRRSFAAHTKEGFSPVSDEEICMAVSVLGVLAHNMIDYNLQFVGIALPFWVLLGVLARSAPAKPAVLQAKINMNRRPVEVLLATFLMILALVQVPDMLLSSLGRHAEKAGDFATAEYWYEQVKRQSFSRDLHVSRAHVAIAQMHYPIAFAALQTSLRLNMHDARAWKLMAELMLTFGNEKDSLQYAEAAFALGKWNDLQTLILYVESLRRNNEAQRILAQKEEFDRLLQAYASAIQRNVHFIALSHNVEDFLKAGSLLGEIFPGSAPRYDVLSAQVDRHASEERSRFRSRLPGYLW